LEAYHSELRSQAYYLAIMEEVSSPALKNRLHALANEEAEHARGFGAMLRKNETLPKADFEKAKALARQHAQGLTLLDLLTLAMEKEREAEAYYKSLAESQGDKTLWVFLLQMAESERKHKFRLQKEIKRLGASNALSSIPYQKGETQ